MIWSVSLEEFNLRFWGQHTWNLYGIMFALLEGIRNAWGTEMLDCSDGTTCVQKTSGGRGSMPELPPLKAERGT